MVWRLGIFIRFKKITQILVICYGRNLRAWRFFPRPPPRSRKYCVPHTPTLSSDKEREKNIFKKNVQTVANWQQPCCFLPPTRAAPSQSRSIKRVMYVLCTVSYSVDAPFASFCDIHEPRFFQPLYIFFFFCGRTFTPQTRKEI